MLFARKNILWTTGLVSLFLILIDFIGTDKLCGGNANTICMGYLYDITWTLFPLIAVFILSCSLLFLREDIFRTWLKFAIVWVPLTMLCTLAAPEYSMSLVPVVKSSVSFLMSAAFFVLSLGIIFARTLQLRGKQQP